MTILNVNAVHSPQLIELHINMAQDVNKWSSNLQQGCCWTHLWALDYILKSSDECLKLYNTTKRWMEMCGPVFDSQRNLMRVPEDIWLTPPVVGP